MISDLFHRIGSFISPFGVMLVFAFLTSFLQLRWGMRKLRIGDEEDASALIFAAGVGGIVGAKIYYAILYGDWHLLFDRSGLVWYGGFLLGTAAVLFTIRSRKLPVWELADAVAPALALGYAVGRIGCFLVGDDYGRPTNLPWGVAWADPADPRMPDHPAFPVIHGGLPPTFAGDLRQFGVPIPPGTPSDRLLAVHPTQIYETLSCLLIWGIGLWLFRRGLRKGQTALTVLALLAFERFLVEILRAKDDRKLGDFTLAQLISVGVFLTVAILAYIRSRRPLPAPSRPA